MKVTASGLPVSEYCSECHADVNVRVAGDGYNAGALRMFEVAVAAPRPRQVPAGRLYQLDRVTDLHCNGWVSRGIAMVNAVRA